LKISVLFHFVLVILRPKYTEMASLSLNFEYHPLSVTKRRAAGEKSGVDGFYLSFLDKRGLKVNPPRQMAKMKIIKRMASGVIGSR
jgi:hypothetical protein